MTTEGPTSEYRAHCPPPKQGISGGAKTAIIIASVFVGGFLLLMLIGVIALAAGVADSEPAAVPAPVVTTADPAPTDTEAAPEPETDFGWQMMDKAWGTLSASEQNVMCQLGPEWAGKTFYDKVDKGPQDYGLTEAVAIEFFTEKC